MPKQMTVVVGVSCVDRSNLAADVQPVTIKLELSPEADNQSEAIVKALRHGANVAAARLGVPGVMDVREAAAEVLADAKARNLHRDTGLTGYATVSTEALERLHKALELTA